MFPGDADMYMQSLLAAAYCSLHEASLAQFFLELAQIGCLGLVPNVFIS